MKETHTAAESKPHVSEVPSPPRRAPPSPVTDLMVVLNLEPHEIAALLAKVTVSVASLIIPERVVAEGTLIRSVSALWYEIVKQLGSNWQLAYEIPPEKWEEIIAGGFKKAGYDEVTWTPRSGDHGRDVIAIKRGFGCVKILGSVKAYAPGNLVPYDAVRALVGVLAAERDASKGIITTTSDFPPRISHDPNIAPFIPTRLELVNGANLQHWLTTLAKTDQ
jgi:restriction system protein